MNKAVFFDRDGTLIIDKIYMNNPAHIEYLPKVFEGLKLIRDCGYKIIVATNQSGISKGIVQIENLYKTHEIMKADFAKHGIKIDAFYYAPYSTESTHLARKPGHGMLLYGEKDFNLDLKSSWMVGDRMTDVEAGHRAHCRTILLAGVENVSKGQVINLSPDKKQPHFFCQTIYEACQTIQINSKALEL
jgi:histidinol-phosphate phosphatase family protein